VSTFEGDARNVVQAGQIGSVVFNGSPPRHAELLPGAPGLLVDRVEVLEGLNSLVDLGRPQRVAVITGLRGAGKTATSVYWAHAVHDRFPDGVLYHDFGAPGSREDSGSGDVLGVFLSGLGVPPADVGASYAARLAAYRSRTYGRRVLLVLDNVRIASQVEDLLPASPDAVVIVTTDRG
jgi:hypothetical protein